MTIGEPRRAGLGLLGWCLVLPALGAAIWVPYSRGDFVLAGLAGVLSVGGIFGHRMGAAKIIGFFVGASVGTYFAEQGAKEIEPFMQSVLQQEGLICRMASMSAVVIGASIITSMVFQIITAILSAASPTLDVLNRRVGFLIGSVQALAVSLFLLCGLLAVEPLAAKRLEYPAEQDNGKYGRMVAEKVVEIANVVRPSPIGQQLSQFNPFEKIEALKNLQSRLTLATDPSAIEKIVKSPDVARLAQQPEYKEAFAELAADPQIQKLLKSGGSPDPQSFASLMNNPAVMKFLDDPKLMGEITKLLPR